MILSHLVLHVIKINAHLLQLLEFLVSPPHPTLDKTLLNGVEKLILELKNHHIYDEYHVEQHTSNNDII